jgi:hypothetical protein
MESKKRKALFFNRHNDKYFMSRLAPPWQLFLRVLLQPVTLVAKNLDFSFFNFDISFSLQ